MSNNELHNFTLNGGYSSGFASAQFDEPDETNSTGTYIEAFGGNSDAIQGIVNSSISRHLSEVLPIRSPHIGPSNWRKRLREIMIHQNETVLEFLTKPTSDNPMVGPVESILRKYAFRQDIDTNSIKTFKELCSDISGAQEIQNEIAACVSSKGPSTLVEIKKQVHALIELYKETGEKLMEEENVLKFKVDKMEKVQKRVSIVIELQTNEATTELTNSLENYLKVYFRDMNIEETYKNLIFLYQKHMALREAIQVYKNSGQVTNEPTCPICLSDSVGTAISPCGHTFCTTCAKRMIVECGVCRGRIRDRVKLFFS